MKISIAGFAALEQRESIRFSMYRDSAGLPTIGVGHLLTKDELHSGKIVLPNGAVDWHAGLSQAQIATLLERDLARVEAVVNRAVVVPLTQAQYDTLVSFTFNVGNAAFLGSTLLRRLNAEDYASVPTQLRRWTYSAGQVDPILVSRREAEAAQWSDAGVTGPTT